MRLSLNIADYKKFVGEDHELLRTEWGRARRLLRYSQEKEFVQRRDQGLVSVYEHAYRTTIQACSFEASLSLGRCDKGMGKVEEAVSSNGRIQFELLSKVCTSGAFVSLGPAPLQPFVLYQLIFG